MANPITLSSDNFGNYTIALTDQADLVVDGTSDTTVQTNPFTSQASAGVACQQNMIASAKAIKINLIANAVTGTPSVTAIAEATSDKGLNVGTAATTNWREIGRVQITAPGASTLPMGGVIECEGPGPLTTFIRVRYSSTGGTLGAGDKFTVNATELTNSAGVILAPSSIVLIG